MNWFMIALRKYAVFSGRARRMEYWYFMLGWLLLHLAASLLDAFLGFSSADNSGGPVTLIAVLALLLPTVAVTSRRLHDLDKSGWWQLLNLVPFIGMILITVWMSLKGSNGANRFGPDPLEGAA